MILTSRDVCCAGVYAEFLDKVFTKFSEGCQDADIDEPEACMDSGLYHCQ